MNKVRVRKLKRPFSPRYTEVRESQARSACAGFVLALAVLAFGGLLASPVFADEPMQGAVGEVSAADGAALDNLPEVPTDV